MRNLILGVSAGLAALISAAPAQAGTVYFHGTGTPQNLPSNAVVISDFDRTSAGTFTADTTRPGTRFGITNDAGNNPPVNAASVRKPADATGNYAYVIGGANYTISFSPAQVFSFVFGSLDATNQVTLNFANGNSQTFVGAQLSGAATSAITNSTLRSGRFYYDAQALGGAMGSIVSAVFTSGASSAFEFDSIATAAPEPATWAMMIFGFGLIGGTLRRKRSAGKMALA